MRRQLAFAAPLACLAVGAVAWAAPPADTTFKGRTSQKQPVSVKTTPDGLKLMDFTITRLFDCGEGEPVSGKFRQSRGRIVLGPNGGFRAKGQVKGAGGSKIKSGQFRFKGRFGTRGRVAVGAYRERVELDDGTECGTGRVTFRVRAR